jgi:hypothetical protein
METKKIKFNAETDVKRYAINYIAVKDKNIECNCAIVDSSEDIRESKTFDFVLVALRKKLCTNNVAVLNVQLVEGE